MQDDEDDSSYQLISENPEGGFFEGDVAEAGKTDCNRSAIREASA
jgi:hypothetical protein